MTPRRIDTPEELQRAMGTAHPPSPQQWAAITAPLAPAVVIAGAGSGKTTLMAARVVYLVLTGQVRPEQVLGLTFTTKAAAELRTRVRDALVAAGHMTAGGRLISIPPNSGGFRTRVFHNMPAQAGGTGRWRLRWQVLALDGHITRGDIPFEVLS